MEDVKLSDYEQAIYEIESEDFKAAFEAVKDELRRHRQRIDNLKAREASIKESRKAAEEELTKFSELVRVYGCRGKLVREYIEDSQPTF